MGEQGRKAVAVNRKARHEYFIEETYDAGIVLVGTEVKSIRAGKANITDSFARIERNELWVHNMYIAPYEFGNRFNPDPRRPRKLLMNRAEIDRLAGQTQQKGLTLIPLQIFFQRGYAKIELGLGRGKKLYDKRESIAEHDREREARRSLAER
jgi:SsrA-binding protein